MQRLGIGLIVIGGLALAACAEEADEGPTTGAPQAVAPVEVTADDVEGTAEGVDPAEGSAEDGDEVTQLRARVAELERQLAESQGAPPSGTETAPIPVPVPGETTGTETATNTGSSTGSNTGSNTGSSTGSTARRRERDPSLLGALLGDDDGHARRPHTNTDQDNRDLRLPNPANILLGE